MRNPERIDLVLKVINRIWKNNPDLRLGQLISNVMANDFDMYHIEDNELIGRLINLYEKVED